MTLEEAIQLVKEGRYVKLENKYLLPSPNFHALSKERKEIFLNAFSKIDEEDKQSNEWEEITKNQFEAEVIAFNRMFGRLKSVLTPKKEIAADHNNHPSKYRRI